MKGKLKKAIAYIMAITTAISLFSFVTLYTVEKLPKLFSLNILYLFNIILPITTYHSLTDILI